MVYLLGVVFIATRFGRGPSVLASVLGVGSFDFLFVEPYFSFSVSDSQFLITLAAMLVVGIVISNLMVNVRSQAKVAEHRERRAAMLYAMSKDLAASQSEADIVRTAVRHLHAEFSSRNVILFPNQDGRMVFPQGPGLTESLHAADLSVAQWVFDHNEMAGQGTNTLPGAAAIYFPFHNEEKVLGVLALLPVNLRRVFLPEQQKLLETFLRLIGQAVARIRFAEQARVTHSQIEAERLRNSLLSAISHDLRTPLATIIGSASTLAEDDGHLQLQDKLDLSRAIVDEAERMSSLVNNILDMARLDAGVLELKKEWHPVEEIIGTALTLLQKPLQGRPVQVKLPPGIPMVYADAVMLEQVIINLLENALRYTPAGSPLEITAEASEQAVSIAVADHGPGIPPGQEERLFEKFYQTRHESAQSGVGLGLAICRAIIKVHGGNIHARNRDEGGAEFIFVLPVDQPAPVLEE
jgi:two-component system sensor histidine kinase KdpD